MRNLNDSLSKPAATAELPAASAAAIGEAPALSKAGIAAPVASRDASTELSSFLPIRNHFFGAGPGNFGGFFGLFAIDSGAYATNCLAGLGKYIR